MIKSNYTRNDIQNFISDKLKNKIELYSVVEGMESQVYSYTLDDKNYIIRINPSLEGFKKDDYAYKNFNSKTIPIPKVIEYGNFNETHYYCISEKAEGITFQDSNEEVVENLLQGITHIMVEINNIDISNTTGYGIFDSKTGNAPFETWKDYLLDIFSEKYDWNKVKKMDYVDSKLVDNIISKFNELIFYCNDVRKLRHGDFGSNNMLVNNGKFSAVIDWDCAGYGDPLYEVASAHFWSTWLMCMDKSYKHYEKTFGDTNYYKEKVLCYELHIGLMELYENAIDKDLETVSWIQNRCREILK